jgi:hypothetical protein
MTSATARALILAIWATATVRTSVVFLLKGFVVTKKTPVQGQILPIEPLPPLLGDLNL